MRWLEVRDGGAGGVRERAVTFGDLIATSSFRVTRIAKGQMCLDLDQFRVSVQGVPLTLTRLEFDLLAYLMKNSHRVVLREELVHEVLGTTYRAESSVIRVHVAHLRQKLGPLRDAIETVRGRGIRFNESHDQPEKR